MNKKFMVIALLTALSTVGYAAEMNQGNFDYVYDKVVDIARETSKNIVELNKQGGEIEDLKSQNEAQNNRLNELEKNKVNKEEFDQKIKESLTIAGQAQNNAAHALIQNSKQDKEIENLKTQVSNNTAISTTNSQLIGDLTQEVESVKGDVDFVKGEVDRVDGKVTDLQNKVETGFDNLQNQVSGNSQALGELAQDVIGNRDNIAANKAEIEKLDKKNEEQDGKINNVSGRLENLKDEMNKANADQNDVIANNTADIDDLKENKLDKDTYENDKAAQEKRDEEQDGKINNVSGRLENLKDEMNKANADQNDLIANNTADIDDLKENKLDKDTYENDKAAQVNKDKEQNSRLDKVEAGKVDKDQYNKDKATISEEIGKVDQKAEEAHNRIDKVVEVNKNQTDDINKNKEDIKNLGTKLDNEVIRQDHKNKVQDGRLDKVEDKNKEQDKAIAQNKQDIADLRNDYTQVNGRLSGLEKKVDNLDNKMNKGLSLMAAMNAVDFQNVQTGEMALGAGLGHYGNAQSVALGVAYSPVEDLTVNAKYSITAGDPDSFAVGAGATYKFKVGR